MSNQDLSTFKYGWSSFGLQEYRSCKGTYCWFPFESLPPLAEAQFNGLLQWLTPLDTDLDESMQVYRPSLEEDRQSQENLLQVVAQAHDLGLSLPEAFRQLMSSRELQDRIPSCTACYFEVPEQIVRCPGTENGYVLNFLHDQQEVLNWYLYLTSDGDHCVFVSHFWLEHFTDQEYAQDIIADISICALSFEAFIYRFWLENSIWFNLQDQRTLTAEQQRYLEHYVRQKEDTK